MKIKKNIRNNIFQLIIVLIVIVLLNIISSFVFKRYDLTSEKRYTLTDYTKSTLSDLEEQIYITIYLDGKQLPIQFKRLKTSVQELLDEFKIYSDDNIEYNFYNPNDEDIEDAERQALFQHFRELGITPIETSDYNEGQAKQNLIFPNAVITYTAYFPEGDTLITREISLNLLNNDPNYDPSSEENINNSINALEYKFVNEINKISRTKKPNIAFIEGHGEIPEQEAIRIQTILSEYYNIMRGRIDEKYGILDEFEAIIIAKPTKEFSEKDKFVLDQYVMNGGKIIWLLDGVNVSMDSILFYKKTFAMPANIQILKIEDLIFKYGVRINSDILQDLVCSKILLKGISETGEEKNHWYDWNYFPVLITKNNHVINKYLDVIKSEFVSSIDTVGGNPDIKKTILLTSSEFTRKISVNMPVEISFDEINQPPNKKLFTSKYLPIAVLLEGNFESLYKNRMISKYLSDKSLFKEKSKETKMLVISNSNLISNVVKNNGETMPLGFDKYSLYTYKGNSEFFLNAVNYLCDEEGLMKIRSRELKLRLLDKNIVKEQRILWQVLNTLLPIFITIIFGIIIFFIRKRKFA